MRVLGIDPGISGALALIEDGSYAAVADMPTMLRGTHSKKQQVNAAELAKLIRIWEPDAAVVEHVNAMPVLKSTKGKERRTMPPASAFNMGDCAGVVRGVLAALGIETHYATPQSWKKRAGLKGSDKEASRMKAVQLWPDAPLARKKDQGRAESLLIARFGVAELDTDPVRADPFRLTQQAAS